MGLSVTKLLLTATACVILPACATNVGGTVADSVPTWLGGMPKGVPPRPGTPEYDAWQAERAKEAARPKTGTTNQPAQ
jgi:hypothetical protein